PRGARCARWPARRCGSGPRASGPGAALPRDRAGVRTAAVGAVVGPGEAGGGDLAVAGLVDVRGARAMPFRAVERTVAPGGGVARSEEHTSELQSRENLVCRLLLEKKNLDNRRATAARAASTAPASAQVEAH